MTAMDIDEQLSLVLADGYTADQKFDICVTARSNPGVPVAFTTKTGDKRALVFPGPDGYQVTYTDVIIGEPTTVTATHWTWVFI